MSGAGGAGGWRAAVCGACRVTEGGCAMPGAALDQVPAEVSHGHRHCLVSEVLAP